MIKLFLIFLTFLTMQSNDDRPVILFFGDSLTAGYGIDSNDAFPALVQKKIDNLNLNYKVVSAGLTGETTAGGLRRINWILRQKIDVFVLELGANDGLRGIKLTETRNNLNQIIDIVRSKYPDVKVVLAGMKVPPNMGPDYANAYDKMFPAVAKEKNTALIPFLLESVGGIAKLNLPDGIHPTEEGHKIVAETVWKTLGPIIAKR